MLLYVPSKPKLAPGETILVEVSADEINSGRHASEDDCAIARALRRITGRYWVVGTSSAICPGLDLWFRLPQDARDFVECWDAQTAGFGPFSFESELLRGDVRENPAFPLARARFLFGLHPGNARAVYPILL